MKLPLLSSKEIIKFLEKEGFVAKRQKGSHVLFEHADGRTTVIPVHSNKDIGRGLLKAILDEISLTREDFFKKWKK